MLSRFRSDILPIGIDVGNDAVKMLQLRRLPGGGGDAVRPRYAVIAAGRRRFSEAGRAHPETRLAEVRGLIRQLRQSASFVGRRAVAAMPSPWIVFRTLRLAEGQPMNRAAIFERLQPQLSAPASLCRLGVISCGPVRQGSESAEEILAFASPQSAVDQFLEALHGGGLSVETLDVEPCAAWRALGRANSVAGAETDDSAMLEMGECRSVLLIGRGASLRFAKPMEIGSRQLDEAICRRLGLTAEDARELRLRSKAADAAAGETVQTALADATRGLVEKLSAGIVQCLRYYSVAFRGSAVRGLYLSGADSIDPHLIAAMQSVPLPLRTWDPFRDIEITNIRVADRRGALGQWTVALGLALRGESPSQCEPSPAPQAAEETVAAEVVHA